jgi:undecaprenyl-diphosphatase
MDKNSGFRTLLVLGVVLFVAFAAFTFLAKTYDVAPVGYNGAEVGFSTINATAHGMFPGDEGSYEISKVLGYICLMAAAVNGLEAVIDFLRHRGRISHMHKRNIITCIYYVFVGGFYVLFEFVVINTRPISAEASYPSSHTMLALCVLYSVFVLLGFSAWRYQFLASILRIICIVAMVSMVVFRFLSGVHWLTDICGGILLSFSLMCLYRACIARFCRR